MWCSRFVVVMGEGTDATRVALGTFLWEEPEGSVAWGFEFTVGPLNDNEIVH